MGIGKFCRREILIGVILGAVGGSFLGSYLGERYGRQELPREVGSLNPASQRSYEAKREERKERTLSSRAVVPSATSKPVEIINSVDDGEIIYRNETIETPNGGREPAINPVTKLNSNYGGNVLYWLFEQFDAIEEIPLVARNYNSRLEGDSNKGIEQSEFVGERTDLEGDERSVLYWLLEEPIRPIDNYLVSRDENLEAISGVESYNLGNEIGHNESEFVGERAASDDNRSLLYWLLEEPIKSVNAGIESSVLYWLFEPLGIGKS